MLLLSAALWSMAANFSLPDCVNPRFLFFSSATVFFNFYAHPDLISFKDIMINSPHQNLCYSFLGFALNKTYQTHRYSSLHPNSHQTNPKTTDIVLPAHCPSIHNISTFSSNSIQFSGYLYLSPFSFIKELCLSLVIYLLDQVQESKPNCNIICFTHLSPKRVKPSPNKEPSIFWRASTCINQKH